jgi:hypothetical protein
MDAGMIFHIILFMLIWCLLFICYRFYKSIAPSNKTLDVSIAFLSAAVICAYLGMLVWKEGILDFLHFKLLGYIICDLKDIYVICFVAIFLISIIRIEKKNRVKLVDLTNYLKGLFKKLP